MPWFNSVVRPVPVVPLRRVHRQVVVPALRHRAQAVRVVHPHLRRPLVRPRQAVVPAPAAPRVAEEVVLLAITTSLPLLA
jgi:hypothetical protein